MTPIWNNYFILTDSTPFSFPQWANLGIHVLSDIFNQQGLRSFQDLKESYSLPGSSWFLYLQLRTALKTYGVPWNISLPSHSLVTCIYTAKLSGFVSLIYNKLVNYNVNNLPIMTAWEKDLQNLGFKLEWPKIWNNIFSSSKNLAHQLINFKLAHRVYFTPVRRFKMKLINSDLCDRCSGSELGNFLHMFWSCFPVKDFWEHIADILSNILGKHVPLCPALFLLGYNPNVTLSYLEKRILLAASTAAKKTILKSWFEPDIVLSRTWAVMFNDICILEKSTAKVNGAKIETLAMWSQTIASIPGLF